MTKEEIFTRHFELASGKKADLMVLRHMKYAINAMQEYADQQTKPLIDEIEKNDKQMQESLKLYECQNQTIIKLQFRISELENKVLESIAPALKYFNGFDTEDKNEAAFHGLNNLNNYITNNPKTN